MSLRFFHIFFIVAASALAVFGGLWMLSHGKPVAWAVVSFLTAVCLDIYLVWFIRKPKGISS